MDFTPSLTAKEFYRFTGPPEHWLTAVKYMTWGLEEKYRARWEEIQPGDVFFIHSTANSEFENAKSGILGIGVIGSNFSVKDNYLWLKETQKQENIWPLLVPLSEIYLFSELPPNDSWNTPDTTNIDASKNLIGLLLQDSIPLSQISGFPAMGSFSKVSQQVALQILNDKRLLHVHASDVDEGIISSKSTKFEPVTNVSETLRYADTLKIFDKIKGRIINKAERQYTKDNELLAKAEDAHTTIVQQLLDMFQAKGYDTRFNKHVDLFAFNEDRSFLIEVKSTENRNFKSQARKGIVQLLEYDYFEVGKFVEENKLSFSESSRILVLSQIPKDENYVGFINAISIGVGTVSEQSIQPFGDDFGLSKI